MSTNPTYRFTKARAGASILQECTDAGHPTPLAASTEDGAWVDLHFDDELTAEELAGITTVVADHTTVDTYAEAAVTALKEAMGI